MKKLFIILALISDTALAQTLETGIWKTKATISLNGLLLPSQDDESCLTEAEAKNPQTKIGSFE